MDGKWFAIVKNMHAASVQAANFHRQRLEFVKEAIYLSQMCAE